MIPNHWAKWAMIFLFWKKRAKNHKKVQKEQWLETVSKHFLEILNLSVLVKLIFWARVNAVLKCLFFVWFLFFLILDNGLIILLFFTVEKLGYFPKLPRGPWICALRVKAKNNELGRELNIGLIDWFINRL